VEALVLILDQREHLLELVEDDQELRIGSGRMRVDRSEEASCVALELVEQRRGGATASPSSADSSSRSG
jgi:hypothetical protein